MLTLKSTRGIITKRSSNFPDGSSIGQFLGERSGGTGGTVNDQYTQEAVDKAREIADGPGFIET